MVAFLLATITFVSKNTRELTSWSVKNGGQKHLPFFFDLFLINRTHDDALAFYLKNVQNDQKRTYLKVVLFFGRIKIQTSSKKSFSLPLPPPSCFPLAFKSPLPCPPLPRMSTPQETEKEKKLRLKKEEALQKLLRVKIAETQKTRERTEKRIHELRCEEVRILTRNKVKLDKLHLETQERIRTRTEKRIAELRVDFLRKEEEEDSLPS